MHIFSDTVFKRNITNETNHHTLLGGKTHIRFQSGTAHLFRHNLLKKRKHTRRGGTEKEREKKGLPQRNSCRSPTQARTYSAVGSLSEAVKHVIRQADTHADTPTIQSPLHSSSNGRLGGDGGRTESHVATSQTFWPDSASYLASVHRKTHQSPLLAPAQLVWTGGRSITVTPACRPASLRALKTNPGLYVLILAYRAYTSQSCRQIG